MAMDGNNCILVAGTSTQTATGKDFALARLLANGTPDTTFGSGGLVTTDFAGLDEVATSMAIQPADGKIILAGSSEQSSGYYTFALARYNTDGSLDAGFGGAPSGSGLVTTDFGDGDDCATGVAVQGDGRIVVSGTTLVDGSGNIGTATHFALARYNSDGSLDTSFGGASSAAGTVTTDFSTLGFTSETSAAVMLDANGRLVVAGTASTSPLPLGEGQGEGFSSFAVACYDPGQSSLGLQVNDLAPDLRLLGNQETSAGQGARSPQPGRVHARPGDRQLQLPDRWGDGAQPDSGFAAIVDTGSTGTSLVGTLGGSIPTPRPAITTWPSR